MTHPNLESQLDSYLDGELAPDDARALEAHIAACAECTRFRDTRLALRAAIRTRVPRFTAPRELREDLRRRARSRRFGAGVVWRSLAVAASLAVVATVVLRDGLAVTPDELRTHCAGRLAGFKVPKAVEFAEGLPRTRSGKLLRRQL